jgi:hypothetical protein
VKFRVFAENPAEQMNHIKIARSILNAGYSMKRRFLPHILYPFTVY